jgi:hypothetical protein
VTAHALARHRLPRQSGDDGVPQLRVGLQPRKGGVPAAAMTAQTRPFAQKERALPSRQAQAGRVNPDRCALGNL